MVPDEDFYPSLSDTITNLFSSLNFTRVSTHSEFTDFHPAVLMQISPALGFHKQQGHFLCTCLIWVRNFEHHHCREKQDWGRGKAGMDVVGKLISQRKEVPFESGNQKE